MMNKEDLIRGEEYSVRDIDNKIDVATNRKFVALDLSGEPLFQIEDGLVATKSIFCRVEQNYWSLDTCPLPPFTVTNKDSGAYTTITTIGKNFVYILGTSLSYKQLQDEYWYIPNKSLRHTKHLCGISK